MKKFLPVICLLLASCSAPSLKDNVKEAQQKTMKDPTSYELLSLEKFKDITYREELEAHLDWFADDIAFQYKLLTLKEEYADTLSDEYFETKEKIASLESIMQKIEELKVKKADSLDVVAATVYTHKFNGKNGLGMVVPNVNFAIVLPDGTLYGIAENEKKITHTPNDFQEYIDLVK